MEKLIEEQKNDLEVKQLLEGKNEFIVDEVGLVKQIVGENLRIAIFQSLW